MESRALDDVLLVFGSALFGVGLHRLARQVLHAPQPVAVAVAGLLPTVGAMLAGQPGLPTGLGAFSGALGSGLYDAIALRPDTFLVFGDTHGAARERDAVIAAMLREQDVDFVVFLGDAVDAPGEWRSKWDNPTKALRERWTVYGVRGNHDDTAGFDERFRFGADRAGGLQIVRMRRGTLYLADDPGAASAVITADAASADHPLIVAAHRCPVEFANEGASDAGWTRREMSAILGVADVVLCGHQHVFGVATIGTTNVVTAGVAGSKHYACASRQSEVIECDDRVRGYLRVTVGDKVNVELRRVEIPG